MSNETNVNTITRYVFDGVEVILTGRKAIRKLPSGKNHELLEIKPAQAEAPKWHKWVKMTDLYEIVRGEKQ